MYKLIIVDDEQYIREGLSSINWSELGIELRGVFKHGLEAYKFIRENAVDVMLIDIRMPIMDGLELSEKVKKYSPNSKMIVLSGHDEFEYAKKSIQNGILDYLLKPIDRQELFEAVKKTVNLLDKERKSIKEVYNLKRKTKSLIKVFRENFLRELLNKKLNNDEIEEGCCYGEIILEYQYYAVSILRLDGKYENYITYSEEDWNLINFALNNIIDELWVEKRLGYYYIDEKRGWVYLLIINQKLLSNKDYLKMKLEELKINICKIRGLLKTTISISIGKMQNINNIYLSTKQAESIFNISNIEDEVIIYDEDIYGETVLHNSCVEFKKQENEINENNNNLECTHYIIESVRDYIEYNYMRTITLEDVSNVVYVNKTYLSYLFKQVMGINFVKYLTKVRIEKAADLLKNPKYKVYQVSEMVGYENSRYFSAAFKKLMGKTPKQYRDNI